MKVEDQCSTKIRFVFDCLLRTGGCSSLNDCLHSDINLFTDILELLIKFKMDRYVLLADIRKAFLMIHLKSERDKNCFCFFVKIGDKLVIFRYKTIIFGFLASLLILSYVVKHHVEKYPGSVCRDKLLSNSYVDNFVNTHNTSEVLLDLYQQAKSIVYEGNYTKSSHPLFCMIRIFSSYPESIKIFFGRKTCSLEKNSGFLF